MLGENLKRLRMNKGLSQEELAIKLNVVRQTVSKWEKGLSVPDSEMLILIADELDTTVNALLGTAEEAEVSELKAIAEKLELVNRQLAEKNERNRKIWHTLFIIIAAIAIVSLIIGITSFTHLIAVNESIRNDISIIGGADGPTVIYLAKTHVDIGYFILCLIIAVAAGVGIYKTKKR